MRIILNLPLAVDLEFVDQFPQSVGFHEPLTSIGYASRTSFIPDKLLGLFERTAWPLSVGTAARTANEGPKADDGARMRGMWR